MSGIPSRSSSTASGTPPSARITQSITAPGLDPPTTCSVTTPPGGASATPATSSPSGSASRLPATDKAAIAHIIDGLLTNNRIWAVLAQAQ